MKVKELLEYLQSANLDDDIIIGEFGKGNAPLELKEVYFTMGEVILTY